jgi:hypothetical protein
MFKAARIGMRVTPLVAIVCMLCALQAPAQQRARYSPAPFVDRPTFDSGLLAASLPSVLSPPAMIPGSRLVSMIAEDIDADGDLDVVANDGSLDLIVWTNDGSGRLSRRHGSGRDGIRSEPAAPALAGDVAQSDTAVPSAFGSLAVDARVRAIVEARRPLSRHHASNRLTSAFVSTRTPRGPPASISLS